MQPRQIVEHWVEAFNQADAKRLSSYYAENAINHQVANQPVCGRDNIYAMSPDSRIGTQ
ncbi:YybH family protein [Bowmanella denitrificans]|nr:hypothetical protein [Bowmanella denitrificans]